GRDRILPIQYDPKGISKSGYRGCYVYNDKFDWLPSETHERVMTDAIKLNKALGYDMNSVEFAIKDGVPYAIDFTNPAPDMHVENILEPYFDTVVGWMVDLAVKAAKGDLGATRDGYRWNKLVAESPDLGFAFPPVG